MNSQMFGIIEKLSQMVVPLLGKQLLYSTILFLVIFPLVKMLKHRSPYWHLGLWTLVLLRLVLSPDLSASWSARSLLEGISLTGFNNVEAIGRLQSDVSMTADQSQFIQHASRMNESPKSWLFQILFGLWGTGVIILFVRYGRHYHEYRSCAQYSSVVRNPAIKALLERYRKQFGITRPIRLVSAEGQTPPFTIGILRPTIFLPKHLTDSSDMPQLNAIIAHEIAHIKHHDHLWLFLQNIIHILYFFHPVAWYASRQLTIARECRCDQQVIDICKIPITTYGESLLKVFEDAVNRREIHILPAFSSHFHLMKYRIQRLTGLKDSMTDLTEGGCTMRTLYHLFRYSTIVLLGIVILPMATGIAQDSQGITFRCPLQEGHITARFGPMRHPITKKEYEHKGIDIAVNIGTPVYAVADGTVILAQDVADKNYGKNIILEHADSYTSQYAKLSEILVQEGQTVKAGEQIALSGNTGVSTGPHLHFELLKNGEHQDPETSIDFTDLAAKQ